MPDPSEYGFKTVQLKADARERLRAYADKRGMTYTGAVHELLDEADA